jgi:hypothetical protein
MKGQTKMSRRFLPQKPKGRAGLKEITHEQIAHAIRSFQLHGGLIRKLPPQESDLRVVVGRQWDSGFEPLFDR